MISYSYNSSQKQTSIEEIMNSIHYEAYDEWVQNFALNLSNIWSEFSARQLDLSSDPNYKKDQNSAIVIGKGPSLKQVTIKEILFVQMVHYNRY